MVRTILLLKGHQLFVLLENFFAFRIIEATEIVLTAAPCCPQRQTVIHSVIAREGITVGFFAIALLIGQLA